jgi:hypothetical protein
LPLTVDEDFDIKLVKGASATWSSVGLTEVDLSNFFEDSGWSPLVTLRSYSGAKYATLDSDSITLNSGAETISFTVPYTKALAALGMIDPGTWTLYATKTIDGVETLTELANGNLSVQLYS